MDKLSGGSGGGTTASAVTSDSTTRVELVIVEQGGDWSGWSRRSSRSAGTIRSIVQQADESPNVFANRVRHTLERAADRSEVIQRVTLVTGSALGPELVGARFLVVLAVGMHLRAARQGSLRIETGASDESVRRSVAAIALFAAAEVGEAIVEVVDANAPENDLDCVA